MHFWQFLHFRHSQYSWHFGILRCSNNHLNSHQFLQIPKKFTVLGETILNKLVTRIFIKYGDLIVTLTFTNSGRSPKNHKIGWNKKWQNCHPNFHLIEWYLHHRNHHQFRQITQIFTQIGDNLKWQNCHPNFHLIEWYLNHLNYHQFRQITKIFTWIGDYLKWQNLH